MKQLLLLTLGFTVSLCSYAGDPMNLEEEPINLEGNHNLICENEDDQTVTFTELAEGSEKVWETIKEAEEIQDSDVTLENNMVYEYSVDQFKNIKRTVAIARFDADLVYYEVYPETNDIVDFRLDRIDNNTLRITKTGIGCTIERRNSNSE